MTGFNESLEALETEDALGFGARHDAAELVVVRSDRPAFLGGEGFGFFLRVDGAHGLGGVLEGRILRVDFRLREDVAERGALRNEVGEFLLNHVADHPEGFGADHVERVHRNGLVGVVLKGEKTDLRAVAVGDDEFVPFVGLGDLFAGRTDVGALVLGGHGFAALQKGVAAESDEKTHLLFLL